eukprot:5628010-Prymnesium_polylepis.1
MALTWLWTVSASPSLVSTRRVYPSASSTSCCRPWPIRSRRRSCRGRPSCLAWRFCFAPMW